MTSSSELVLAVRSAAPAPLCLGGGEGSSPHLQDCGTPEAESAEGPDAFAPPGRLLVSNSVSD